MVLGEVIIVLCDSPSCQGNISLFFNELFQSKLMLGIVVLDKHGIKNDILVKYCKMPLDFQDDHCAATSSLDHQIQTIHPPDHETHCGS